MNQRHVIIYADDDYDDINVVKEIFDQFDYLELIHANNGNKTLDILLSLVSKGISPCLIILDINMPVLNGRQTLEAIKRNQKMEHIPTVLFSSSYANADLLFAQKWNSELIKKPLKTSDIDRIAKHFIEKFNYQIDNI